MKKCYKCEKDKESEEFSKNKRYKDGLNDICKICKKEQNILNKDKIKEYYKLNKEEHSKYHKLYNLENKEKIKEYSKQYYSNPLNKERQKKYVHEYEKIEKNKIRKKEVVKRWNESNPNYMTVYMSSKYKNDIDHKLLSNLRSRLYHAIKGTTKKSISSSKLLGCSIEEYKLFIQNQFKPEMAWLNHGEIWEIDHIIGCCNFDLTKLEEQQKCFHYTNMEPIFKTTAIAEAFRYKGYIGNRDKEKY